MSVDGIWNLSINSPTGNLESRLEIRSERNTLVGTQTGQGGSIIYPISNGKLDGDNISWTSSIEVPVPLDLEYTGVVAGDVLSGKVKAGSFGVFDFTGSRA